MSHTVALEASLAATYQNQCSMRENVSLSHSTSYHVNKLITNHNSTQRDTTAGVQDDSSNCGTAEWQQGELSIFAQQLTKMTGVAS